MNGRDKNLALAFAATNVRQVNEVQKCCLLLLSLLLSPNCCKRFDLRLLLSDLSAGPAWQSTSENLVKKTFAVKTGALTIFHSGLAPKTEDRRDHKNIPK